MTAPNISIGQALDLGVALAADGRHRDAIEYFRGVLVHEPDNFEAIARLGVSLFEMKSMSQAFFFLWRAKQMRPRDPMALMNFGLCASNLGALGEGLVDLERAVRISERLDEAPNIKAIRYNNLGNTLERIGRHAEALVALDKGIAFDPGDPFPHYNRGIVLLRLNRHREGIEALEKSRALRDARTPHSPSRLNDPDADYNLGLAYLTLGDLKRGFPNYEARMLTSDNHSPDLNLDPATKWKPGESIAGRRIMVHGEQGLGDAIQFLRFIEPLRELGPAEILIIEHAPVWPLLPEGITLLKTGESIVDRYDVWVPLMSLPFYLGVDSEDKIPAPYWFPVETDRVEQWNSIVKPLPDQLNVGLCWAGNFRHKNDAHRSIPLATFAKLFEAPANFVSVQQMRQEDLELFAAMRAERPNLQALYLDDFRDTAAVLLGLDLVITVDTSVAHVAATLGIPTWILLPAFSSDWRWQLERTDSPWYPSAKLYRQTKVGDWKSVLDRVTRDLTETAAQRAVAHAA